MVYTGPLDPIRVTHPLPNAVTEDDLRWLNEQAKLAGDRVTFERESETTGPTGWIGTTVVRG